VGLRPEPFRCRFFCVIRRFPSPQTPLPRGFMGGQKMCSVRDVFPVLTRRNALTPSLRATPLPRAAGGEGHIARRNAKNCYTVQAFCPPLNPRRGEGLPTALQRGIAAFLPLRPVREKGG
jgi:hypothetical protein